MSTLYSPENQILSGGANPNTKTPAHILHECSLFIAQRIRSCHEEPTPTPRSQHTSCTNVSSAQSREQDLPRRSRPQHQDPTTLAARLSPPSQSIQTRPGHTKQTRPYKPDQAIQNRPGHTNQTRPYKTDQAIQTRPGHTNQTRPKGTDFNTSQRTKANDQLLRKMTGRLTANEVPL